MNQPRFIDTSIFLHYLTQDSQHYQACLHLFQQAERNQATLVTSETVIVEIVTVLSSPRHYNVSHQQIQVVLSRLLLLPGLKVPNRMTYLRALALYAKQSLVFGECLNVAHMEQAGIEELYSYDRGAEEVVSVKRLEPELPTAESADGVQSEA